jgi:hypothetical protein
LTVCAVQSFSSAGKTGIIIIDVASGFFARSPIPVFNLRMLSLSDSQLASVMHVARDLPQERRSEYLRRVAALLHLRGRYDDRIVGEVCALAATGIAHKRADVA